MVRCKMCSVEGVKLYEYGNMALCIVCYDEKCDYDGERRFKWAQNRILMRKNR